MSLNKRSLLLICASCIIATGLFSCASDNTPKPNPVADIKDKSAMSVSWRKNILSTSYSGSFVPVLDGNAVFTADSDGNIFRLDNSDGTVITKIRLKRDLSSGTAVSSDSVFVTTQDGYLLSVSKVDGTIKWQAHLPTISIEAPQVAADVVIVRTNDAEILAYNVNDGRLLWVYQKQIPPLTVRANTTFQVLGKDVVLAGMPGGRLILINISNGSVIWETYIAVPEGSTDLDKLTDVTVRPVVSDKMVCAATYNGKIACLDAISSNIIWSKNFSTSSGVQIDEQNVYAVNQDGVVYAFDKSTGRVVWQNDILEYRFLSAPAFLGANLLVVDADGYINLFARSDGKLIMRTSSGLEGGLSLPLIDDNKLILQSASGEIAKVSP